MKVSRSAIFQHGGGGAGRGPFPFSPPGTAHLQVLALSASVLPESGTQLLAEVAGSLPVVLPVLEVDLAEMDRSFSLLPVTPPLADDRAEGAADREESRPRDSRNDDRALDRATDREESAI